MPASAVSDACIAYPSWLTAHAAPSPLTPELEPLEIEARAPNVNNVGHIPVFIPLNYTMIRLMI